MTSLERGVLEIRPATRDDGPAIVRIERSSFSDPWSASAFDGLIGRDEVLFDVATRLTSTGSAPVVGFCVAYVIEDSAELANVAVDAGARREGIGGRLLDHVMTTAAARGARELFLEVRLSNAAARSLYEARGFATVGRRARYYVRPDEDALVLRRVLP